MIPVIKPAGVGDLKVTKYKLARYEAGEVAHVENVLARERRTRNHRRLRQLEEIQTLEVERVEESLRDLQSTERFELQNEVQKTIRSETGVHAGVQASGGFGPVSLTAYASYDATSSQEESDRNASEYAKEITEKTVARLTERVREERRTRTLEETEEQNEHTFNNEEGVTNISGVYRWVDKYYRAKVVDYGKRLFYEFVVPEPAALYAFATQYNLDARVPPHKPEEPVNADGAPLTATDITRKNYLSLAAASGAIDIPSPPPRWTKVSKAIHREVPEGESWAFSTEDFKVPPGYYAYSGAFRLARHPASPQDEHAIILTIGLRTLDLIGEECILFASSARFKLSHERDHIPVHLVAHNVKEVGLNIEAWCHLLHSQFEKWQVQAYAAIMNAHQKAVMSYEERIAAAGITDVMLIGSENPAINRQIELRELKRACIAMWAGLDFDQAGGIDRDEAADVPDNFPEIDIANATANADATKFFESAFDWSNVTYEFLAYFWGRKPEWLELLSGSSKDPVFEAFLQAGAARVVVPVQPAFAEAVLYYQLTGEIWSGGEIHAFDDPFDPDPDARLYNSYLNELASAAEIPGIEQDVDIARDDSSTFLVKVPTTLVWLQPETTLPNLEA